MPNSVATSAIAPHSHSRGREAATMLTEPSTMAIWNSARL